MRLFNDEGNRCTRRANYEEICSCSTFCRTIFEKEIVFFYYLWRTHICTIRTLLKLMQSISSRILTPNCCQEKMRHCWSGRLDLLFALDLGLDFLNNFNCIKFYMVLRKWREWYSIWITCRLVQESRIEQLKNASALSQWSSNAKRRSRQKTLMNGLIDRPGHRKRRQNGFPIISRDLLPLRILPG